MNPIDVDSVVDMDIVENFVADIVGYVNMGGYVDSVEVVIVGDVDMDIFDVMEK